MKKLLKSISLFAFIAFINFNSIAQECQCGWIDVPFEIDTTRGLRESKNGWYLPVNGTIRVLIAFIEMEYQEPSNDPSYGGTVEWPAHQLPDWANELCDHEPPTGNPQGLFTRYFHEASSGNYIVIGDYLLAPDNGGVFSISTSNGSFSVPTAISTINNKLGTSIVTANGYSSISDFDKWTLTGQGLPKIKESNNKWDHVMFVLRNSKNPPDTQGSAYPWGFTQQLLGFQADTYSQFCTHESLPIKVMRHEYAHLILGGNNFHVGGGKETNYWIPMIGGWSMLGLSGSSLLTPG